MKAALRAHQAIRNRKAGVPIGDTHTGTVAQRRTVGQDCPTRYNSEAKWALWHERIDAKSPD